MKAQQQLKQLIFLFLACALAACESDDSEGRAGELARGTFPSGDHMATRVHDVTFERIGGNHVVVPDMDGDGYDELAVSQGDTEIVVIYGSAEGIPRGLTLQQAASATVFGASDVRLGASLATGDVDGDGLGDLLIGAPSTMQDFFRFGLERPLPEAQRDWDVLFNSIHPTPSAGSVYILYGSEERLSGQRPVAEVAARIGEARSLPFSFGQQIFEAGDINGDGRADFWIAAQDESAWLTTTGPLPDHANISLFLGTATRTDRRVTDHDALLQGQLLGLGADHADLNGDGLDDAIVGFQVSRELPPGETNEYGEPHELEAGTAIFYGSKDFGGVLGIEDADVRWGADTYFSSTMGTGDVTGDGHDDLLLVRKETAHVVPGPATPHESEDLVPPNAVLLTTIDDYPLIVEPIDFEAELEKLGPGGYIFHPPMEELLAERWLGPATDGRGDFDGDGQADIALSAEQTGFQYAGLVDVFMAGQRNTIHRFEGPRVGAALGSSLSLDGDLNGDGCDDLIMTSNGPDGVRLHIVYGSPDR